VEMQTRIVSAEILSDECRANNPTSLGLRFCSIEEFNVWDRKPMWLNDYSWIILGSDAARAELRSVQRAWLFCRDAEFDPIESKSAGFSVR